MHKLSSYNLKIIAITTMVLDHALKIFSNDIINIMQSNQIFTLTNYIFFMIILAIGRVSFPLFAYMIAEGCYYTKNIKKYILQLLALGIISEIPFQFMIKILTGQPYQLSFSLENVFFTLAFGAIAIEGYKYIKEKHLSHWTLWLPVIICAIFTYFLNTDYAIFGVILIFLCYYFRETKYWYCPTLIFSVLFYLGYSLALSVNTYGFDLIFVIEVIIQAIFSCFALFIIYNYNHQRGKPTKWFFYIFYPLHISILVCLYFFIH